MLGGSGKRGILFSTVRAWRSRGVGSAGPYADIELGALPSSSPFRTTTSCARRSPSTASASSFAHKLFCRPSKDELVLHAESPAARPSWGVEPAASIARRRRSRSCHGRRAREAAPRRRGGAKSAMSGELSSDATPLAKGPRGGGPSSLSTPSIVRLTMWPSLALTTLALKLNKDSGEIARDTTKVPEYTQWLQGRGMVSSLCSGSAGSIPNLQRGQKEPQSALIEPHGRPAKIS